MVDLILNRNKKYLACYVILTIFKSSVNNAQKCLKPFTIIFATLPSQIMTLHCFVATGTNFLKIYCFVFVLDL